MTRELNEIIGWYNISVHVIKHSPLANIMNLSLQKGFFPDKLKIA